jgi:Exonuclease
MLCCRARPPQADSRSYASAVGTAAPDTAAGSTSSSTSQPPSSLPGGAAAAAAAPRAALVQNALIWVDLEMTGLDPRRDSIIEIAVIVTDGNLHNEVAVRSLWPAAVPTQACLQENRLPQCQQMAAAGQLQQLAAEAAPSLTPALSLQGPDLAIHHSDEVLDGMNAWSCEHHGASGLTARCRASTVSMQVCCSCLLLTTHLLPVLSAVKLQE